jgi:hypothetical protein
MWVKTQRDDKEEAAEPKYEEEDCCGAPENMKMNMKLRTNTDTRLNMSVKLNMKIK